MLLNRTRHFFVRSACRRSSKCQSSNKLKGSDEVKKVGDSSQESLLWHLRSLLEYFFFTQYPYLSVFAYSSFFLVKHLHRFLTIHLIINFITLRSR